MTMNFKKTIDALHRSEAKRGAKVLRDIFKDTPHTISFRFGRNDEGVCSFNSTQHCFRFFVEYIPKETRYVIVAFDDDASWENVVSKKTFLSVKRQVFSLVHGESYASVRVIGKKHLRMKV